MTTVRHVFKLMQLLLRVTTIHGWSLFKGDIFITLKHLTSIQLRIQDLKEQMSLTMHVDVFSKCVIHKVC